MEVVALLREGDRARLRFARDDRSVNLLDETCMVQLERHLDDLERDPPGLLVLESGLPGCFVAGADLDLLAKVDDPDAARRFAERGQAICRRLEDLSSLTVAVVRGACMGGGLELALACDHLIAVRDAATRLGLPEIRLGIHPGFGGCVRLPKRIGWPGAVRMILGGRPVDADRAARIGLATLACHPDEVDAAVDHARAGGARPPAGVRPRWLRFRPLKALFFRQVKRRAFARLGPLDVERAYPAVPATVRLLSEIVGMSDGLAYAREAESLGVLAVTPTCKNLIRVFHLRRQLRGGRIAVAGEERAAAIDRVRIIGAGVMGGGIARVAAAHGDVDLHDTSEAALGGALKRLASACGASQMRRIRPAVGVDADAGDAAVLEAIAEDIDVKRALWEELSAKAGRRTLLLSNTSSLSIGEMQGVVKYPGRMAGMHFFNPAPKMPLVEVVKGRRTTRRTVETVAALAVRWGKLPVVVADRPGFLINRCLTPYLVAALRLVEGGQKVIHVDGALKNFGMPMGALELADRVGLDICLHVADHLREAYGERCAAPAWLRRMVEEGLLGAKAGHGFYRYAGERRREVNPDLAGHLPEPGAVAGRDTDVDIGDEHPATDAAIVDACLLPMLAEALASLADGTVGSGEELDAALVFGIGFPPFRGGLLHHFAGESTDALKARFERAGLKAPRNLTRLRGEGGR